MKFAYKNAFQELPISLRGRVTNILVVFDTYFWKVRRDKMNWKSNDGLFFNFY